MQARKPALEWRSHALVQAPSKRTQPGSTAPSVQGNRVLRALREAPPKPVCKHPRNPNPCAWM